jgi:hypothetical protein
MRKSLLGLDFKKTAREPDRLNIWGVFSIFTFLQLLKWMMYRVRQRVIKLKTMLRMLFLLELMISPHCLG